MAREYVKQTVIQNPLLEYTRTVTLYSRESGMGRYDIVELTSGSVTLCKNSLSNGHGIHVFELLIQLELEKGGQIVTLPTF